MEQLNIMNNSVVKHDVISPEEQLATVRNLYKVKYMQERDALKDTRNTSHMTNTPSAPLKCRLQKLAEYRKSNLEMQPDEKINTDGTTCIIGDSIVKHITPWKIKSKLRSKQRIVVKSFSGAKTTTILNLGQVSVCIECRMDPEQVQDYPVFLF